MGKETWARRIGGREQTPGPGDYKTELYKETGTGVPCYTIKGRYPDPEPRVAPEYREMKTTVGDAPRYTIRPKTGAKSESNGTPGPDYVPPLFANKYLSRPNNTLTPREKMTPRTPRFESYSHCPFGPAKSDTRHRPGDSRAPAYSIGNMTGVSWLSKNNNPGSADYFPDKNKVLKSAPKYSLHGVSTELPTLATPGPGEYNLPDNFGKRKMTVRPKTGVTSNFATPGPGEYEVQEPTGSSARRCSIRPLYSRKEIQPGVGYHDIVREFDKPKRRSISPRTTYDPYRTDSPGPGTYSPATTWRSNVGYKMSPRNSQRNERTSFIPNIDSPGPAEYGQDCSPIKKKEPRFIIGGDEHQRGGWIGTTESPGPGYNGDDSMTKPRPPKYTIRPKTRGMDAESPTKDAGYVNLRQNPRRGGFTIRQREELDLIAE